MKTIYVTHHVLVERVSCLMVEDEADLAAKLADMEKALKETPFSSKLQRDKAGKPLFHQCNKDWLPYP